MTNAELRQLAEIERRLTTEYPDLTRLFAEAAGRRIRSRRRWWLWAGVLVAVLAAALLGVGLALGLAGLAVTAACPVVAYAVVLGGYWLAHGGWSRLRARARRRRA
jgi:undecaprenyl pyrophosphate phosphatase UppP